MTTNKYTYDYYNVELPDGRFVAFFSYARNLVPGDTNGAPDIFVHDRVLVSGVSKSGSVVQGRWVYYQIDDSDSITDIKVELTNLSADVDLYVNEGSLPTLPLTTAGPTNEERRRRPAP